MLAISKHDNIHTRRACILKSLCIYLNEDYEKLIKEYLDMDSEAKSCMEQTVMGVYVIQKEGAEPEDDPEDIGVVIEGVEALTDLGNIAQACALLFGLIYCLNLSYPPELKCTFEVLQKIILNLDGQKLSSKAQFLKNKLMGWEHLKMTDRSWMVHWRNGDFQYIMLTFEFIFFFFHLKNIFF